MQVAKWGNSLAVRLPVAVVKALQLREGDDIRNMPFMAGDTLVVFTQWSSLARIERDRNFVVVTTEYPREELPESLTAYIVDREDYDYRHHAEVGSSNAEYIEGDVIDRFSLLGAPEAHVERLLQLADVGVDQFNIYLMNGDEEAQLEAYGNEVIPAFKAAVRSYTRGR